jgi:hypothetical protein
MSRTRLPQVARTSVRNAYEYHLAAMEENKTICDEIIAEQEAKAKHDIHKHPPTLDTTWEFLAERALADDPDFQRHSGKYRFHQARVNTLSGILMLAQNERIIALLTQISDHTDAR